MFTNLQLVEYMKAVKAEGWVYWYGTFGNKCSQSLYNSKKKQYPSHYGSSRKKGYMADIAAGKTCADCVNSIKSFFWKGGDIKGKLVYRSNNCPDINADGLYKLCSEKGKIGTIPDIPGLVVWKKGHIGVYIGGGETIEMRGFAYDCVQRRVEKGPWTNWGRLPASLITYVNDETQGDLVVTGDGVNIRKGPGTQYAAVASVNKGARLQAVNAQGWVPVRYQEQLRWVSGKYVKEGA